LSIKKEWVETKIQIFGTTYNPLHYTNKNFGKKLSLFLPVYNGGYLYLWNMKKVIRLTESDLVGIVRQIIKESENTPIGKVYFNDKKYPGFMYVKEILPKYKMYWVGTESHEVLPAELTKDDDMDIYWLESPDGETFGYEIFEHDNKYLVLTPIDPQELEKYLRKGGKWFPSNYKG